MMSDPIGTVGSRQKVAVESDLHLAFEGGDKFLQRIKDLSDTRDSAQAAFDNLGVGRNAHAAFAQAKTISAAADGLMEEARVTLDRAKEEASGILQRAHDAANAVVARATTEAHDLRDDAGRIRDEAQKRAEELVASAREALERAQKKQTEADGYHADLMSRIDQHETEHSSLMEAAAAAKADAEALQDKLSAKLKSLKSLLGD